MDFRFLPGLQYFFTPSGSKLIHPRNALRLGNTSVLKCDHESSRWRSGLSLLLSLQAEKACVKLAVWKPLQIIISGDVPPLSGWDPDPWGGVDLCFSSLRKIRGLEEGSTCHWQWHKTLFFFFSSSQGIFANFYPKLPPSCVVLTSMNVGFRVVVSFCPCPILDSVTKLTHRTLYPLRLNPPRLATVSWSF